MLVQLGHGRNNGEANGKPSNLASHRPMAAAAETWYLPVKRLMDCMLALLCMIPAAPLVLLATILVRLTSRGPAFYSQTRLGRGGVPFRLYKLRTMYHDCERLSGPCWSSVKDPRVTLVGRLLRKTHIDELPQLWNVLRGDMSLVGPRPERPELIPPLARKIPGYLDRLAMRPGLTGLAQLQLPPDRDLESVRRKLACDLHYIKRYSLRVDVAILLGTTFHLIGIPFGLTSRLLGIPRAHDIVDARSNLLSEIGAANSEALASPVP